ncbi:MAG: DUF418 domain-containing protein [Candidatus Zixiibacteriota bacterium]
MTHNVAPSAPTAPSERIVALDALRGFAVLGILIMNIQIFAMIEASYLNPTAFGDLTGINKWVSVLSHLFADGKFLSIFSILFGAGIVLMTSKVETEGGRSAGLHYRRTLWLIVIGLMHAYLLWYGDILVGYGMCALLVFLFRKLSPRLLLLLGVLCAAVSSVMFLFFGWSTQYWPQEAYQQMIEAWTPSAEIISREIAAYQGGWTEQMSHRLPTALKFQTQVFLVFLAWRAGGLMLIGMALFKWGVLTAQRSRRFYLALMSIGFGLGFPVVIYGIVRNYQANWSFDYSMFIGVQFNYWGSILVVLGYISLVMLICKSGLVQKVVRRFAAVGRMALTNYLLQTIICTTIFYGHGLGLFGRVERSEQILIVIGIWVFQLLISPLWLGHFQFGPAEWLWRTLTYLRVQPMRRRAG